MRFEFAQQTLTRALMSALFLALAAQANDWPHWRGPSHNEFESFRARAVWEHLKFSGNNADKAAIGCYFYGTFHVGWRDGWTFYPADNSGKVIHEDAQLQEPDGHNIKLLWANFLQSIETAKRPAADIELAHCSTSLSLVGMLSLKLGRSIQWDGESEIIVGDPEANKLLSRPYRGPWEYPPV